MKLSPHDEQRIAQLRLLAVGPVIHHWNRVDGLHSLSANGKEYGPSKDLSDLIRRAAWDVQTHEVTP